MEFLVCLFGVFSPSFLFLSGKAMFTASCLADQLSRGSNFRTLNRGSFFREIICNKPCAVLATAYKMDKLNSALAHLLDHLINAYENREIC